MAVNWTAGKKHVAIRSRRTFVPHTEWERTRQPTRPLSSRPRQENIQEKVASGHNSQEEGVVDKLRGSQSGCAFKAGASKKRRRSLDVSSVDQLRAELLTQANWSSLAVAPALYAPSKLARKRRKRHGHESKSASMGEGPASAPGPVANDASLVEEHEAEEVQAAPLVQPSSSEAKSIEAQVSPTPWTPPLPAFLSHITPRTVADPEALAATSSLLPPLKLFRPPSTLLTSSVTPSSSAPPAHAALAHNVTCLSHTMTPKRLRPALFPDVRLGSGDTSSLRRRGALYLGGGGAGVAQVGTTLSAQAKAPLTIASIKRATVSAEQPTPSSHPQLAVSIPAPTSAHSAAAAAQVKPDTDVANGLSAKVRQADASAHAAYSWIKEIVSYCTQQ